MGKKETKGPEEKEEGETSSSSEQEKSIQREVPAKSQTGKRNRRVIQGTVVCMYSLWFSDL